ncbi:MAG: glycerol-3-phosphate responsive antiterminator [Firmicutes bacterium]|nr:glycerol-3-phosphate responsive antiterminator [Bacillota bacterium]
MKISKDYFLELTIDCPVIPEVKNEEWLDAIKDSESKLVYILYGDVCNIADIVTRVHEMGKLAIVHIDLIEGLATKPICVEFIKKNVKADGIISTKPVMIQRARDIGLFSIQRFFMMDGITYSNISRYVKQSDPDVVELMPAGLVKVIPYLVEIISRPVVATGLIQDKGDIIGALNAGAVAVATTNRDLWDC